MTPINFDESNGTLSGGPAAKYGTADDVTDLPVHRAGGQIMSCWKLSPLERVIVLATGKVWLRVLADRTHFPVKLEGESPFKEQLGERLLNWCRERLAIASGHKCAICSKPSLGEVCSGECGAELARSMATN